MKKQRYKIYVSLAFVLLWLCALWGTASEIATVKAKAGNYTSYSIAKATAPSGLLAEEELSRTLLGGDIKNLSYGLPVPQFTYYGLPCLPLRIFEAFHTGKPKDLKHRIAQLLFPFHFFY
ncbi:hypothetical protein LS482_10245 [Sinomicrobium kalidii]|uniref:hypothetical protein n=1 Tax=Sinomicrobium kalidii TaxID=2900738 RepID=UPI001E2BBE8F|nr:hypothetical protein [Sinomicrobium kalidii]UGU18245.1 hypothetical protein LS482_10245 [Sinomicrobium kalidii]